MKTETDGSVVLGANGMHRIADGRVTGKDPLARYGPMGIVHFRRLDEIAHVGDLAIISRMDEGTDEVAAFEAHRLARRARRMADSGDPRLPV